MPDARIAALDGIRGLAVIAVVLFHVDLLAGGWVGVDVFFVLSGFLITSLLLDEHRRRGSVSLRSFWARRVRRLAPVLFVVLATTVVAWTLLERATASLRGDVLAALGYVANWHFIQSDQSYFASFEASPLRHAWSLAIEEQFYLLWPLAFLLIVRLRPAVAAALLAGAAALSTWWMHHVSADPDQLSRAYYGSDTRAATIVVGCLAALVLDTARRRHGDAVERVMQRVGAPCAAAAAVVLGVVAATVAEDSRWLYRNGGFALVALVAVVLVVAAANLPRGRVRRFLSGPALVRVGLISYGLYLWHWPVIVALDETALPAGARLAMQLALPVLLAELTYRTVERPIRRVRLRRPGVATAASVAAVAGLTLATTTQAGATPLVPEASSGTLVVAAPPPITAPTTTTTTTTSTPAPPSTSARPSTSALAPTTTTTTTTTAPLQLPLDVAVLGDSVAWIFAGNPAPDVPFAVRGYWHAKCDIVGDRIITGDRANDVDASCPSWPAGWAETVREPVDAVIVVVGLRQLFDPEVGGVRLPVGSPEWEAHYRDAVGRALAVIRAQTAAPVLWFDVPCYSWAQQGTAGEERDGERLRVVNAVLRDTLAVDPAVRVVDYGSRVCDGTVPNETLRPDGAHLTPEAAHDVWRWLAPMILEDVARRR